MPLTNLRVVHKENGGIRILLGATWVHKIPDLSFKPFCVNDIAWGGYRLEMLNGKINLLKGTAIIKILNVVLPNVLVVDMNSPTKDEVKNLEIVIEYFNGAVTVNEENLKSEGK